MSKVFTLLTIAGLLCAVAFSQTTTTTTCDPTTCKATTTGTVKAQCCGSDGKCATDSSKCQTCGGIGIYCAGVKNPSGTCDASKCQYGCCKSDGTCGAQADCASGGTVCTGAGCSTCCNANKLCVFSNQTDTCKYCTNDFLTCPGVSSAGDLKAGTCESKACQYGCCTGKVCGTAAACAPSSCDVDNCNKTNGIRCCMKSKACASSSIECYYCENSLICAGQDVGATCDANLCQFKCCDGTKCGSQEKCASSKSWIWWVVGGVVGGLLLLTLLICYLRARRRRLLLQGYPNSSSQYGYNAPPAQYSQSQQQQSNYPQY